MTFASSILEEFANQCFKTLIKSTGYMRQIAVYKKSESFLSIAYLIVKQKSMVCLRLIRVYNS